MAESRLLLFIVHFIRVYCCGGDLCQGLHGGSVLSIEIRKSSMVVGPVLVRRIDCSMLACFLD
jgi:hypothetical protein